MKYINTGYLLHSVYFWIMLLGLFPATLATAQTSSPVTLNGTVWSAPTNYFPPTEVSVYDNDGMVLLGSTTTAPGTGQYQITIFLVGTDDKLMAYNEMLVLSNPVKNEVNLGVALRNEDNYTISVHDAAGGQLYQQSVALPEGSNRITLYGLGDAGMKLIQVSGPLKTWTAKVMQTENAVLSPVVHVTPFSGTPGHTKTSSNTTQLKVQFTPTEAGYVPNFKVVPAISQVVNDTVMQVSQTINKVLHVYDVNGLPVAPGGSNIATYYTLKTQFKDGTIIDFPTVNGLITINRTEYGILTDTLIFIPDTIANHKFMEWMIGRKIQQQRYEPNVFVNDKPYIPGQYNPPGNVHAIVANMPTDMQLYLVPEKMLDPRNMTDSIRLDNYGDGLTLTMLEGAPPIYSTKFVDVTNARPLYFIIDTWDHYDGSPVSVANLDRTQVELEKQVTVIPFLANGDSLLPEFVITREDSYNSTIYQQILARGANQYTEIYFELGQQPGGGWFLTYTGSYNGKMIMKAGVSDFWPSATDGVIGEEIGHGTWCINDPYTGGIATFIYNTGSQNISDYWKTIIRWKLLLDPGTYFD